MINDYYYFVLIVSARFFKIRLAEQIFRLIFGLAEFLR